jgi:glyoxylase-like metal-dependent hydrolase (beta-lactamase superfamily II)
VLTNRHHDRNSQPLVEELGLPVLCHARGLHEFDDKALEPEPYRDGEEIAPGIVAHEVLEGWYGECVLHVPDPGVLIIADTVIREPGDDLSFVPDRYMGDDPEEEKEQLRAGLRPMLELEFDHMLFAHGPPWIGGAKAALRDFVGS